MKKENQRSSETILSSDIENKTKQFINLMSTLPTSLQLPKLASSIKRMTVFLKKLEK